MIPLTWSVVGNVPLDRARLAIEPIGHEDLVFLMIVAVCEDIGALKRLGKVTKYIKDEDDGFRGVIGTGDIYKIPVSWLSANGHIGPIGLERDALQVLMPPISSYLPLATYPFEMTGGMLQQASVWPWVAGMVDILTVVVVANDLGRDELVEDKVEAKATLDGNVLVEAATTE
jgi:hypothetical protein